jgi:RNA polymerase Rpb2, domain 5
MPQNVHRRPLFIVGHDQKLVIKKSHIQKISESHSAWKLSMSQPEDADQEAIADEKFRFGWDDILYNGLLEYIDTEEEETTMIAMKPDELALPLEVRVSLSGIRSLVLSLILIMYSVSFPNLFNLKT